MTARASSRARQRLASLGSVPLYPTALVVAFVISQFTVWWPPVYTIVRPLVVLILVTVAIQLVASRLLGPVRGALVTALLLMAVLESRVAAVIAAVAALAWLGHRVRWAPLMRLDQGRVTRPLNVVAVGALGMAILAAVASVVGLPPIATTSDAPTATAPADAPDIYLILLDGYPRADVLSAALDFDNEPFLSDMRELGFELSDESHSNYNRTLLTLASFLNGAHVNDLMPDPPDGVPAQNRWIASLINRASAVASARSVGYRFIDIPTDVEYLTPVFNAEVRASDRLTAFELTLADYGLLRDLPVDVLSEWHRNERRIQINDALDTIEDVSRERSPDPRLVFAHVKLPHPPVVFAADGSALVEPECVWWVCDVREPMSESAKESFRSQMEYTNARTLSVVREIIENAQRPPVVVVFSDHGFRHWLNNHAETYRSVLLAYTPGHPGLFPQAGTPVNIVPRILNAYAGAKLPLAREDVWYVVTGGNGYFPLRESDTEPE